MKTFAFFYFMNDQKNKAFSKILTEHTAYWKGHNFPYFYGGTFADSSGGLIIFQAGNQKEAEKLISKDPFVIKDLLKDSYVKEWTLFPR